MLQDKADGIDRYAHDLNFTIDSDYKSQSKMAISPTSILVINPNSSQSVTDGLAKALGPIAPPETSLTFYTAPSVAPPSINDVITANLSASACFADIKMKSMLDKYDGFLVCCCE